MARRGGVADSAIGVAPIGDRPGTTTVPEVTSWRGTPAGKARMIAAGSFVGLTLIHLAAEARYSGE